MDVLSLGEPGRRRPIMPCRLAAEEPSSSALASQVLTASQCISFFFQHHAGDTAEARRTTYGFTTQTYDIIPGVRGFDTDAVQFPFITLHHHHRPHHPLSSPIAPHQPTLLFLLLLPPTLPSPERHISLASIASQSSSSPQPQGLQNGQASARTQSAHQAHHQLSSQRLKPALNARHPPRFATPQQMKTRRRALLNPNARQRDKTCES
ncbi:hypothetical protein BGZ57DRAFT_25913 [Hyaloscypha finlandica]|nr:hypothetical protein BGZ57DRAFT_25913 [Hyaloscypha finlandica]